LFCCAARVVKHRSAEAVLVRVLTVAFAPLYCAPFRRDPGFAGVEAGIPESENIRSTVLTATTDAA